MHLADLRVFTEPQQGATYDDLLAVAQHAERLGYGGFFRSDHYLKMGSVSGLPGPTDSWVTLAGIARETDTIRLGTMMTSVTFRYPGPLAISVAQVDQMSGGRIELGIGAGWYDAEHAAYAIPSFAAGLDACRRILRRGATPAVLRLYDDQEAARSLGLPKPGEPGSSPVLLVLDEADPLVAEATMAVVAALPVRKLHQDRSR